MSGAATSKEAAAFCADLVRTHDFARYAATLFLPQTQRCALLSIYAFNVEISRVRDQVSQPLPGEIRMQWWTDMLTGAGHGDVEGNPVAAELLRTTGEFRLPAEPLLRLIEEHQFDLYNDPMPSMAALEGYVTETSSALFSLGARIFGTAVGRDRPSRAPRGPRPGHGAGDRGIAARCRTATAVLPRNCCSNTAAGRKRSIPASSRRVRVRRSINWRGRPGSTSTRLSNCSRMCGRRYEEYSCRWRWCAANWADGARRLRPVRAAADVPAADVVDAVARVADEGVRRVKGIAAHEVVIPAQAGIQYAAASRIDLRRLWKDRGHPPSRVTTPELLDGLSISAFSK